MTGYGWVGEEHDCVYLPDRTQRLRHIQIEEMTTIDNETFLVMGWRRFGRDLFRPVCERCRECRSLRVLVDRFRPSRSQERCRRRNRGDVRLDVVKPEVREDVLELYRRFHDHQAKVKGWPEHDYMTPETFRTAFVDNPVPTEQWEYRIGEELVGVGYVDPTSVGPSAMYFFRAPEHADRGLGTWNVLNIVDAARRLGRPYVYLGYYVSECASLAYKAKFRPNEILDDEGVWRRYRE